MPEHTPASRRAFLATTAGTFTVVGPGLVRGSQANSAISVGLIGCGGRGTYDATIVRKDERARITALCDLYDDRIERAKQKLDLPNPAVHKDFAKLLASEVDAVIIATPPFEHPRMLEAAVDAKKHIYCEKPMGVDVEGCKRVMKAGRKADPKKNISVGFQQRYSPEYREGYRRMKEGEIGELAAARAYWIGQDPFKRVPYSDPKEEHIRNWFCYKDTSGDFIVEQDCHNFDVLHWYLGLPVRVTGYGGTKIRTSMEILDHLSLSFEFPNGIHVNFEANQISPPGYGKVGEEFSGTKGIVLVSRGGLTHIKGQGEANRETIRSKGDITVDAISSFLGRIQNGEVENVAERSALSTMIAILGRTAIYTRKEVTWKGLYGA